MQFYTLIIVLLSLGYLHAQCPATMTYNGKTYNTVQIGTQCWMAENLSDDSHTVGESYIYDVESKYNYVSAEDAACLEATYGHLYKWDAAMDIASKIPGWHLPTDQEWKTLEKFLGMTQAEADKQGFRGTNEGTKLEAESSSGFKALLGGFWTDALGGFFDNITSYGYFWTSSMDAGGKAWYRYIQASISRIGRETEYVHNRTAHSIRLIKD